MFQALTLITSLSIWAMLIYLLINQFKKGLKMVDLIKSGKNLASLKYDFKIPYPEDTKTIATYRVKVASGLNACWFSGSHKTNKNDALQEIKPNTKIVKYMNMIIYI